MSISITDEHRSLAQTVRSFVTKHDARGATRALLEAPDEERPRFWNDLAEIGWLGLHVAEEHGGSGYGLAELLIVVEELGRAVAPGPFVPTAIASAVIGAAGTDALRKTHLPGLADGSRVATLAHHSDVICDGRSVSGSVVALSGDLADILLVPVGGDLARHRDGRAWCDR